MFVESRSTVVKQMLYSLNNRRIQGIEIEQKDNSIIKSLFGSRTKPPEYAGFRLEDVEAFFPFPFSAVSSSTAWPIVKAGVDAANGCLSGQMNF